MGRAYLPDLGAFPHRRMRRNRTQHEVRALVAEHELRVQHLIWPCFVVEGAVGEQEIPGFPEVYRYGIAALLTKLDEVTALGIGGIAVFPVIDGALRTADARAAFAKDALILRAVKAIRERFPTLVIICDVAFDPYTSHGHDGLLSNSGDVDNDRTVEALGRYAVTLAEAGCDTVAPSDMMDGRIGSVRAALDRHAHSGVRILAYTAKYASALYGPFRQAVQSGSHLVSDKTTYQMDFRNSTEALHEAALDLKEGADWIMVKPGLAYLDIIYRVQDTFGVPVFAYHVSGEYAALRAAADRGWLELDAVLMETLIAFRRAGATGILTYGALRAARCLQ